MNSLNRDYFLTIDTPKYHRNLIGITKRTFMDKYGWLIKATVVCIVISILL